MEITAHRIAEPFETPRAVQNHRSLIKKMDRDLRLNTINFGTAIQVFCAGKPRLLFTLNFNEL